MYTWSDHDTDLILKGSDIDRVKRTGSRLDVAEVT